MSHPNQSNSLTNASSRLQEKASDAFHTGRITTADGLDSAAGSITAGGDRVAEFAHSTADSLGASAKYLRMNDSRDMLRDIESLVKAHPGKALLGAVVLGFFAGRAFSRD